MGYKISGFQVGIYFFGKKTHRYIVIKKTDFGSIFFDLFFDGGGVGSGGG